MSERPIDALRELRRALLKIINDIEQARVEVVQLVRDIRPKPLQSALRQRRPVNFIRRKVIEQKDDNNNSGD